MKILAIRGMNLTSLARPFELDLGADPLTNAGLFAITGRTGSGKTTLLDALCLPLFDRVPRYQYARKFKIGDLEQAAVGLAADDPRNILRKGAAEGFAEVDFSGIDGGRYRARWSVRRARGRADGRIQNQQIEFWDLDRQIELGDSSKTVTLGRIEEKLGLDADQFFRSVLLVQGDFASFLKANASQRADLLERMTGTGIYSTISQIAFERAKAERERYEALVQQSELTTFMDDDQREKLAASIQEARNRQLALDRECAALIKARAWHEQLAHLIAEREAAEQSLTVCETDWQALAEERSQLAELEKAQPLRPHLENLDRFSKDQSEKEREYAEAELFVAKGTREAENAAQVLIQAEEARQKAIHALESARPEIEQARELDIRIDGLHTQLLQAQKQERKTGEEWREAQARLSEMQAAEAKMRQDLARHETWLRDHQEDQQLTESHWQSTLERYADALIRRRQFLSKSNLAKTRHEEIEGRYAAAARKLEELRSAVRSAEARAQEARMRAEGLAASEPGERVERLREQVRFIEQGLLLEQRLAEKAALWVRLDQELSGLQRANTKIEEDIKSTKDLLVAKSIALQDGKRDLALVSATRELAERRSELLRPGMACPLCGSQEHPYENDGTDSLTFFDKLHQLVDDLQRDRDELLKQESQSSTLHSENKTKLATLREEIEQTAASRAQLEAQASIQRGQVFEAAEAVDRIEQRGQVFEAAEAVDRIEPQRQQWGQVFEKMEGAGNIEKWKSALDKVNLGLVNAREQLKLAELAEKGAREVEEGLRQLRLVLESEHAAHEQIRGEAIQHQLAAQRLETDLAGLSREIGTLEVDCSGLITRERNEALLKTDPKGFLAACRAGALAYRMEVESRDMVRAKLSDLEKSMATVAEQVKQCETALPELKEAREGLEKQLTIFRQKRTGILGGHLPKDLTDRLNLAIKEADLTYHQVSERSGNLEKSVLMGKERVDLLGRELAERSARARQSDAKFREMLIKVGFEEQGLRLALRFSEETIQAQRVKINACRISLDQARTILEERRTRESSHRAQNPESGDSVLVATALQTAKDELAAVTEQGHRFKVALEQDDAHRAAHAARLPEIQAQQKRVELWEELNKLIGSRDGAKFKRFAQSLTLDILLEHAGRHLLELEPRYRLERIPGENLEIQIVDQFMGDEVRGLHSLSGGESFLISLALALGLSSLASNRAQIESLFIDEGFGALDNQALDVALAALDSLQASGRQIGIISHLSTIAERVGVRVEVVSDTGGTSQLKIINV